LLCHVRQTIVGVPLLFAIARNSFEAGILGQSQRDLVFAAQLFEFRHDAIRHARYAFCQQAVHHGSYHIELFTETRQFMLIE
jgi:hypothetical protein